MPQCLPYKKNTRHSKVEHYIGKVTRAQNNFLLRKLLGAWISSKKIGRPQNSCKNNFLVSISAIVPEVGKNGMFQEWTPLAHRQRESLEQHSRQPIRGIHEPRSWRKLTNSHKKHVLTYVRTYVRVRIIFVCCIAFKHSRAFFLSCNDQLPTTNNLTDQ